MVAEGVCHIVTRPEGELTGVWTSETGLKRRVQKTELSPVAVDGTESVGVQASVELGALKRGDQSANGWLRGHAGHAVSRGINGIGTSSSTGNHGCNTCTSRVVGMNVDRNLRILLPDGTDELSRSLRLEHTSHILQTNDMGTHLDDTISEAKVVLEVVLGIGFLIAAH